MKPIRLTRHAQDNMQRDGVALAWIEAAVRSPDWTAADPEPPKERRYRRTPELDGRVLRVVCVEAADHVRVVTVFPDRDAKPPDGPAHHL